MNNNHFFYKKARVFFLWMLCSFPVFKLAAQAKLNPLDVYVDQTGVMRFSGSKEELKGFGINYTMPFAYAYRNAKKMGVDIKKAIDDDVYHFARLGFDAFRVHVWDTEISDTAGNVLDNEHLELFDYMLWKMKQRGMRFLITPIAYWGNGWPEPDEKTAGFSAKFGKGNSLTNPEAIKAQQNYLYQFLNHVNRYTQVAYKNEPAIVAFEISNEPHHGESPEQVTAFIKGMIGSMRSTGCVKPILYNISHKIHLDDAYFNAGINGGTFQWYPTGLGFRQELQGNLLPNVDNYQIPFANKPGFKKIAKVVYEFDAADVGRSYIYPAMARSFRTAGIQWATHFAYDPTYSAYANTEYNTHFMNLPFTPQKALSLMIAGEVFHRVPLYKSYGAYPADTLFDAFHVSYQQDLAEMITDEKFIYTNNTNTAIAAPQKLQHIAGYGNSQLVKYHGTGAYFLDKLADETWRLEVMPDAIWVDDPFGRNSLDKTVAVVNWREQKMRVQLPGLGDHFYITALNDGNRFEAEAVDHSFTIKPGTYLLANSKASQSSNDGAALKNIGLREYFAPAGNLDQLIVKNTTALEADTGQSFTIMADIISAQVPELVELHVWAGFRPLVIAMKPVNSYQYTATIPAAAMREGFIKYYIAVKQKDGFVTFPSGKKTYPRNFDFYADESYTLRVVPHTFPIYIFDAATDAELVARKWVRANRVVPSMSPNKAVMEINIDKLLNVDDENKNAEKLYDYSMRFAFANKIAGRMDDIAGKKNIVVRGRALNNKPCTIQIAFVTKDAVTYGAVLTLNQEMGDYLLPIESLHAVPQVLLPRPYPSFLPYYYSNHSGQAFDIKKIEVLQLSIGPGIAADQLEAMHGIAIESIRLE